VRDPGVWAQIGGLLFFVAVVAAVYGLRALHVKVLAARIAYATERPLPGRNRDMAPPVPFLDDSTQEIIRPPASWIYPGETRPDARENAAVPRRAQHGPDPERGAGRCPVNRPGARRGLLARKLAAACCFAVVVLLTAAELSISLTGSWQADPLCHIADGLTVDAAAALGAILLMRRRQPQRIAVRPGGVAVLRPPGRNEVHERLGSWAALPACTPPHERQVWSAVPAPVIRRRSSVRVRHRARRR
jgi:hypothetical protein